MACITSPNLLEGIDNFFLKQLMHIMGARLTPPISGNGSKKKKKMKMDALTTGFITLYERCFRIRNNRLKMH